MSKGIVTEYPEICIFCGRQAEAEHHLIFGTAGRELSEKDGLKIPVCNNCHNMGQKLCRMHENPRNNGRIYPYYDDAVYRIDGREGE